MTEKNVVVHIFGEDYPITGVEDPAHVTRVAEYVDTKMQEVARVGRTYSKDKVAILTAMSLASELLEKQQNREYFDKDAVVQIDRILADLNRVIAEEAVTA
jgi:cell division protein ZapA